jgi:hypothetical protein
MYGEMLAIGRTTEPCAGAPGRCKPVASAVVEVGAEAEPQGIPFTNIPKTEPAGRVGTPPARRVEIPDSGRLDVDALAPTVVGDAVTSYPSARKAFLPCWKVAIFIPF